MTSPQPQSFAALRHPGFRTYFTYTAMTMMADSIEHVISYWIMFQKFHSPALGGYAILSHWLPFLFFGVYVGGRMSFARAIKGAPLPKDHRDEKPPMAARAPSGRSAQG